MSDPTEILDRLGIGHIPHPGGDLRSHLGRTYEQLRAWSAPDDVCLAGLTHAAYGTDGFPQALLPLDERPRLRSLIGDEAEAIVYTYCSCDRSVTYARLGEVPLPLADRFVGDDIVLTTNRAMAFAALTLANELDIVRVADLDPATTASIAWLFAALAPYVPDASAAALTEIRRTAT